MNNAIIIETTIEVIINCNKYKDTFSLENYFTFKRFHIYENVENSLRSFSETNFQYTIYICDYEHTQKNEPFTEHTKVSIIDFDKIWHKCSFRKNI